MTSKKCPWCQEEIPEAARKCRFCHEHIQEKSIPGRIWAALKLPILFGIPVIATGLLTGWLVPHLTDRLNRQRVVADARLRIAREVVQEGTSVESQIGNFQTIFELFYKDSLRMTPKEFRIMQDEMRKELTVRYLNFEGRAWWWFRQVEWEANFPEPLDARKQEELETLCDKYLRLLNETTSSLDILWSGLLRTTTDRDKYGESVSAQSKILGDLGEERRKVLGALSNVFAEKRPHSNSLLQFFAARTDEVSDRHRSRMVLSGRAPE